jgi:hypothetical protein
MREPQALETLRASTACAGITLPLHLHTLVIIMIKIGEIIGFKNQTVNKERCLTKGLHSVSEIT